MKRKVLSLLSIVLFICLACYNVFAAEINITLENNSTYKSGETVEISVKVNNIILENGIETIIGKISYNKELYESCTIEESNNWEADFNSENGRIILQRDEGIKENHEAFVIKLTIKDNIVNNDTISFTDINIADEETDLFPQNVTTSIAIENVATGEEEPEREPGQTPGGEEENPQQQDSIPENSTPENNDKKPAETDKDKTKLEEKKEDDTTSKKKFPNTGLYSATAIIAIISIFVIVSFIKANKYKQI